jgi:hypothetical protein
LVCVAMGVPPVIWFVCAVSRVACNSANGKHSVAGPRPGVDDQGERKNEEECR